MRATIMSIGVAFVLCVLAGSVAHAAQADPQDIEDLFKELQAPNATEPARVLRSQDGFIRFAGAPPGGYFATSSPAAKGGSPTDVAQGFVTGHQRAFALAGPRAAFAPERVRSRDGVSYIHLQQTYNGLRVFGAEVMVQVNPDGGIACIATDICRDTALLDTGAVPLTPGLPIAAAEQAAREWTAREKGILAANLFNTAASRLIFDPVVVGQTGPVRVVWMTTVYSTEYTRGDAEFVAEVVFVDAHSGEIVFNYTLAPQARRRLIYDANHVFPPPLNLVRSEGQTPCPVTDANLAYDYFGDTYDFYWTHHGRDAIDNKGLLLKGTVRYCEPGNCPLANAFYVTRDPEGGNLYFWEPDHMYFGDGFVADDIVAHELTHGVTSYESNLIYAYQSGAINEALSDIWGEFVDLTNGRGTDTADVRWLMGEDAPGGAIRNMANPPQFGNPDRVGSPYYYYGRGDYGGVHTNSGVINKLCYLLTDGDTFNGYTVAGFGIVPVAQLFYELQTNLLTEASDFEDLYMQLGQATVNLGYAFSDRMNVKTATRAVEIAPLAEEDEASVFRATPAIDNRGRSVVAVYWEPPATADFRQAILVRNTGGFASSPTEGMELYRGLDTKYLDTAVIPGTEYFYTLFIDMREGFPSTAYARAIAGRPAPPYYTEAFSPDIPFDLSFSQLLFAPTGPASGPLSSTDGHGGYEGYTVTLRRGIYDLPVKRQDLNGTAYDLPLADDDIFGTGMLPVPFFQTKYVQAFLSSNGYLAFGASQDMYTPDYPSFATHFSKPRISFLFADLDPNAGGTVWFRRLDDRIVVTFENVPEWRASQPLPSMNENTVQVEVFYSGQIRMTYLEVNAQDAVVGLSDGQGAPVDPVLLFPNLLSQPVTSDLAALPRVSTQLSFEPAAPPQVDAGQVLEFVIKARIPQGFGIPSLTYDWDGPGTPVFVDNGDGSARFRWATQPADAGQYTVRVTAQLDLLTAYQDVTLLVGTTGMQPMARNLRIRTNSPVEDPTRSRVVGPDTQLIAEYDYVHPLEFEDPALHGEASSQIQWFKNRLLVPAYRNSRSIPATATQALDQWFFVVVPRAADGTQGAPVQSPIVTVVDLPDVFHVVLPEDVPPSFLPEDLPLPSLPPAAGPSTGGTKVIVLGRRFRNTSSVTFGGIEALWFRVLSDYQIEAETPPHIPSPVVGGEAIAEDVVVTTLSGAGVLKNAFTYTDGGVPITKADVNGDGRVDAVDVQLVINAVLGKSKGLADADVNRDGRVNASDIQVVVNEALSR